mmetsp:Transcript_63934/g.169213  ORF Transcript_63934/g.169213 Transcript_63934/m.169213 type:complete len:205 (+) Transcript_63934:738-1352(+)
MGITIGDSSSFNVAHVLTGGNFNTLRMVVRFHSWKGFDSNIFLSVPSAACEVMACSIWSITGTNWCVSMDTTADQSLLLLGIHDGCKMKPQIGFLQYSPTVSAMPATVNPYTIKSTGWYCPCSSKVITWSRKTVVLSKKKASDAAIIEICTISDVCCVAHLARWVPIYFSVSPPDGLNIIFPFVVLLLLRTKLFQRSSVQMVTR